MPGGCEGLVHWRSTVEELARSGAIPPVAIFDIDQANMFCNVEWQEISAAVRKYYREVVEWVDWSHKEPEKVLLPCGDEIGVNRGAGQGDVFGSALASLSQGERVLQHRTRMRDSRVFGCVDEWYIDDGQGVVLLEHADAWLKSLDQAISDLGGFRKTGAECKSHARLVCTPEFAAQHSDWASEYISSSCVVGCCTTSPKVLGAHVDDHRAINADMDAVTSKVASTRDYVESLNCPIAELTLQRVCLNLSKASYILRCNGDCLESSTLSKFDSGMASGVESALWGPLPADSWIQATLAVECGGLGLREATNVALPAFLASRTVSRPLVAEMASRCEQAGLCTRDCFMSVFICSRRG